MTDELPAIRLADVSKKFGQKTAVTKTTLSLDPEKIYALIGPNGAGKTTLVKMMVGLLSPSSGTIELFGKNISQEPTAAKRLLGYISDDPTAYDYLTGMEFLFFTGKLRGLPEEEIRARADELVKLFPLAEIIRQPMAHYSRGNRQKVALLSALMDKPKLLFIDEPVVGLDPYSLDIFGNILSKFRNNGGTVFMVTHTLTFANTYADSVLIMNEGKILKEQEIRSGTELKKLYKEFVKI